ncbi:MAG: response regulator [Candidatus Firestonebacteria bacterium]|nr:response regulator [Candidatus Firestonebacteria bacterium]
MSKSVLAVDDEPAVLRLIQMSLMVEGYDIRTVTSGYTALAELEKKRPDLMLLDILMPGLNGYELCAEVRRQPRYQGMKIVFLTALGNLGDPQRGIMAGADDYIIKPFDPDELLSKVRDMIGPSQ